MHTPKKDAKWTVGDELNYVDNIGTGKYSLGADLRHSRQWWLKKYLEATETLKTDYILKGRQRAELLLAEFLL